MDVSLLPSELPSWLAERETAVLRLHEERIDEIDGWEFLCPHCGLAQGEVSDYSTPRVWLWMRALVSIHTQARGEVEADLMDGTLDLDTFSIEYDDGEERDIDNPETYCGECGDPFEVEDGWLYGDLYVFDQAFEERGALRVYVPPALVRPWLASESDDASCLYGFVLKPVWAGAEDMVGGGAGSVPSKPESPEDVELRELLSALEG